MRVDGIPGSRPNLTSPPAGCRFHFRRGVAYDECHTEEPPRVDDELRSSRCLWARKHPGKSVPLKAVTSETLGEADPVLGVTTPSQSEPHSDHQQGTRSRTTAPN